MLLRGLPQGKISNPFLVDSRCRPRQHEIHEKVQKLSACDLVRFEQALEHASLVDSQDLRRRRICGSRPSAIRSSRQPRST